MDPKLLSGGDLAFLGDAYYELAIRKYVLGKEITSLYKLHDECVKYVSRDAQYKIVTILYDELSEEEQEIFRRGRNYSYKTKTVEYIHASGFEAVIGHLYLTSNFERLEYIIDKAIKIIEENNE